MIPLTSASVNSTYCKLTLILTLGIPKAVACTVIPEDSANVNSPTPIPSLATDCIGAGLMLAWGKDTDCAKPT